MPLRLSELLERIRPAGSPGAPTEGEQQRQVFDRALETAEIEIVLAAFQEEADRLIAAAVAEAEALGHAAERQTREINSAMPGRIASVQAAALQGQHQRDDIEQSTIADETTAEIARLKTRASSLTPSLVEAATDTIWAAVRAAVIPEDQQ